MHRALDVRSNGLYKILVDYCKGCRVCIEECPTGCLEGVPELDFDTGVVRMDTAFAMSPGLHGRQAEELRHLDDRRGEATFENRKSELSAIVELTERDRRRMVRINGCVASAQAAKYADVDVIAAYPIRPYTATMMALAQMVANGELDAEYIVADSEHSQLSIAHGASSSGARVFTGSSGVGVQFAYELYSPISGSRMPVQMMIADRTLDPPGDFGSEHTDALSTRDMGWLMGWSCDAQEAFDNHLIAYRIGEDPRVLLPQMVCQDGFFVSHITSDVELPDTGQVKEFLPPYKHPYPLDPRHPVSHGPQIMPEQGPPLQLERARAMEGSMAVIEQAHEEFAQDLRATIRPVGRRIHDRGRRRRLLPAGRARRDRALRDQAHARSRREGRTGEAANDPALSDGTREGSAQQIQSGRRDRDEHGTGQREQRRRRCMPRSAPLSTKARSGRWSFRSWPGMGGEAIVLKEFYWMTQKMLEAQKRGKIEKRTHWVGFEE